jgi:hypothetical protein
VALAALLQFPGPMLLHRPFTTGLGMACCLGLMWRMTPELNDDCGRRAAGAAETEPAKMPANAGEREAGGPCAVRSSAVNVVDVAAGAATPELIAQLIRLGEDERVAAVDDRPVGSDLAAGAWIAARFQSEAMDIGIPLLYPRGPVSHGDYIDLTIEGGACSRRVLVLFH